MNNQHNKTTDSPEIQQLVSGGYKLTPLTLGMRLSYGRYLPARHLMYASAIIASAVALGNARIIFSMPPRHGKSEFCSHYLPVWFLERWHTSRVMLATYGADLSKFYSRKVRDTITTSPDLLSVRIRDDASNVADFLTQDPEGYGGMLAAGIGGPITGRGFQLGLIDDYIKNAEDSLSVSQLGKTWDWFLSTFYTRAEPNASILIFATRWNIDDLIGRCKTELSHEKWTIIDLPALAMENDPLGREVGEPLWPERYNTAALSRIKLTLGNYWWDAMYQQQPRASMQDVNRSAHLVKVREADLPHHTDLRGVRAWDFAASEASSGKDPDYTVGVKFAVSKTTGRFFILDIQRFRKESFATEVQVRMCATWDTPQIPVIMEQEPGSSGKTFVANYTTRVLTGYNVEGIRPTGPIEFRASAFIAAVEAGLVSVLEGPWNEHLDLELDTFPNGKHDDIISACSLAYNKLVVGQNASVIWGHDISPQQISQAIASNYTRRQGVIQPASTGIITGVTW